MYFERVYDAEGLNKSIGSDKKAIEHLELK